MIPFPFSPLTVLRDLAAELPDALWLTLTDAARATVAAPIERWRPRQLRDGLPSVTVTWMADVSEAGTAEEMAADVDRSGAAERTPGDILRTLLKEENALAWGPVIISALVVIGFFSILGYLMVAGFTGATADPVIAQMINIAVGALTAGFATVLSFWLGSSDSSRRKDVAAAQSAAAATQERREQAEATERLVERVAASNKAGANRLGKEVGHFKRCLDLILEHEGGYVDHPKDPGGATNMGITHRTLASWRGVDAVSKDDVRALERAEAAEIYRANYWNAAGCDGLPAGVDLVVFDFGVNAGVGRAARLLQGIVHVEQDGQIGPITQAATVLLEPEEVIEAFSKGRMRHYRSLSIWETFKRGWTKRTDRTKDVALEMAAD